MNIKLEGYEFNIQHKNGDFGAMYQSNKDGELFTILVYDKEYM